MSFWNFGLKLLSRHLHSASLKFFWFYSMYHNFSIHFLSSRMTKIFGKVIKKPLVKIRIHVNLNSIFLKFFQNLAQSVFGLLFCNVKKINPYQPNLNRMFIHITRVKSRRCEVIVWVFASSVKLQSCYWDNLILSSFEGLLHITELFSYSRVNFKMYFVMKIIRKKY